MSLTLTTEELIKRTTSRCPVCLTACPAEVWKFGTSPAKVYLRRNCPEHGTHSSCISSDARFYWLSKGSDANACCGAGQACRAEDGEATGVLGRNAYLSKSTPFEKLSTCLALIELVDSCNLACPTCYADSPTHNGEAIKAAPLDDLQRRIQGVIDRKGGIEILQLSGGEPTLHPKFFEFLAWAQAHPKIDYVLLNTNGVRIAREDAFLEQLAKTARLGHFQLYLQFDGPGEKGQRELRGADLRELRIRALERCGEAGIPVTLAMTVNPANLDQLWATVELGLKYPQVRGVSFQPMFQSGRTPAPASAKPVTERLNTADVILNLVAQSGGKLGFDDFTPLPCGDPNCATIGYLLKIDGQVRSLGEFINFKQLQGFLHDRVRYRPEDLEQCGCESEPLGALLKEWEMDASHTFRLFIKPFMDAWSWDEDRIDRCCTHVIRPDGKLDSFCRYYSNFPDTKPAPAT